MIQEGIEQIDSFCKLLIKADEKLNAYKFADYKDQVIDLLKRVCTVSVRTMGVVREMERIDQK